MFAVVARLQHSESSRLMCLEQQTILSCNESSNIGSALADLQLNRSIYTGITFWRTR